jgi:site-specific DNA recombinase
MRFFNTKRIGVDQATFGRKSTEIRDRRASIKLQLDPHDRSHDETAELALKVFELSQTFREQWLTANYDAKRRILEIVCLNCWLDGATLMAEMRKPFDVLAEGLISENSRGNKTAIELFVAGVQGWEAGLRRRLEDGKPLSQ